MASDTRDTRKHKEKKRKQRKKKEHHSALFIITEIVCTYVHMCVCACVRACVCVYMFVSLRHMVIGLPSTHGMKKKAASSSQCRSVNINLKSLSLSLFHQTTYL